MAVQGVRGHGLLRWSSLRGAKRRGSRNDEGWTVDLAREYWPSFKLICAEQQATPGADFGPDVLARGHV